MSEVTTRSGGILTISYENKEDLYKAYMPFVKNGGLFIPTIKSFSINDGLFIVLHIPESTEKTPVSTKVIWITPIGAQGKRTPGIGVQFRDEGVARTRIETSLAGLLKSNAPTLTM